MLIPFIIFYQYSLSAEKHKRIIESLRIKS